MFLKTKQILISVFYSPLPINEDMAPNSNFINVFGKIVSNIEKNEKVYKLYEVAMLNTSEVVKDMTGFSQNGEKAGSKALNAVMPPDTFRECDTLSLKKGDLQVACVRYMYNKTWSSVSSSTWVLSLAP